MSQKPFLLGVCNLWDYAIFASTSSNKKSACCVILPRRGERRTVCREMKAVRQVRSAPDFGVESALL